MISGRGKRLRLTNRWIFWLIILSKESRASKSAVHTPGAWYPILISYQTFAFTLTLYRKDWFRRLDLRRDEASTITTLTPFSEVSAKLTSSVLSSAVSRQCLSPSSNKNFISSNNNRFPVPVTSSPRIRRDFFSWVCIEEHHWEKDNQISWFENFPPYCFLSCSQIPANINHLLGMCTVRICSPLLPF